MVKPHHLAGDLRYGGIVSPLPEKHLKIPFDFCTKSPRRNPTRKTSRIRSGRGGAPRSESKSNDRRGRSHNNSTDIIRPPTLQVFGQNRIGRVMYRCCKMYHVSTLYHQIPSANVRYFHCRRFAPTLFPLRGNNRADNIRPYADVPHCTRCVICGD